MSLGQMLPSYPTIEEVSSRVTQAQTRLLDSFVANRFLDKNVLLHQTPLAVSGVAAVFLHSNQDPQRLPSEVNYILRNTQFKSEFIPLEFVYRSGNGLPPWDPAQGKSEIANWKNVDRTHLVVQGRTGVRKLSAVRIETMWIPVLNSSHLLLEFIEAQHRTWIDLDNRKLKAKKDYSKVRYQSEQKDRTIVFILMLYCINTLIKIPNGWPTLSYDDRARDGDFATYLNSFIWFRDTFIPLALNPNSKLVIAAVESVYEKLSREDKEFLDRGIHNALNVVCHDLQALLYPPILHSQLQVPARIQHPLPPRPPTGQPPHQFSVGKRGSHERLS
ncbi:hypothetical protein JCM5350_006113 [Sporobolomyces pararoseus]